MENKLFQKRLDQLAVAPINFDATAEDAQTITQIAIRAINRYGKQFDGVAIAMDITACHLNGCPMRLKELLEADDFNFGHDVLGIRKHLNRDTGKLMDCFLPRFAAPQEEQA